MKEKIKKILTLVNHWKVILVMFLIGFSLFYWYEIRLSRIYSTCHYEAIERAMAIKSLKIQLENKSGLEKLLEKGAYSKDDYDYTYKQCLRKKGIHK